MDLQIQCRNLQITNQVRHHVTEKLEQLSRHLPALSGAVVEISSESTRSQRDRIVAQVTLDVDGSTLWAEQRAPTPEAAVNSAAEILGRRIERYKGRVYRSERARQTVSIGGQQAEEAVGLLAGVPAEELADGDLVKVKRFNMKPMTVEEAAFRMQLLGHKFFMFLNSQVDRHNVLYQREDGNFGLIQPAE